MPNLFSVIRFLLISLGLTALPSLAAAETPPCWLQAPVTSEYHGQIGVARNLSADRNKPETLSRQRAVERLCQSIGRVCSDDQIRDSVNAERLGDQALYFDSHVQAGNIFSYASVEPVTDTQCSPTQCNLTRCDPAWLCSPSRSNSLGILGVSYRSMSLSRQQALATENALFQAQFLHGVDIRAAKQLRRRRAATGHSSLLLEHSEVTADQNAMPPYRILSQCYSGSSLFQQVEIDLPKPTGLDASVPAPEAWLKSPKQPGLDGAVGAVERRVASGLLSDQLDLAIRRAAIELAFEQNSRIKASQVVVTTGSGGLIDISLTQESTDVSLKARAADIHFQARGKSDIAVYVWLVRIP